MRRIVNYESILASAAVAGVFSVIVCALLLFQLLTPAPMLAVDEPAYVGYREQLTADRENEDARRELRALDIQLRANYFQRQAFTRRGATLLLIGLATTFLFWQGAALLRPQLPEMPPESNADSELRANHRAQWASAIVTLTVLLAVVGWKLGNPSHLRGSLDSPVGSTPTANSDSSPTENLAAGNPAGSVTGDVKGANGSPTVSTPPPTAEEFAANWYRFRGPLGAGVAPETQAPQTWNGETGEAVKWKTPVPLPGLSSPIVWNQRVFLTGADRNERAVFCFDADTGEMLWRGAVNSTTPNAHPVKVDSSTGFAAPTPVTDGRRVYAIFATGDIAAFDFAGKPVWNLSLGVPENPYGHAASLAIWKDRVIVQLDQGHGEEDVSKLIALDGSTGKPMWTVERQSPATWSSPIVVARESTARVITCSDPWVIANDAETGKEIWRAECLMGEIGPSPVYRDGVVYVASDGASVAAIRDEGEGNVTETNIIWKADFGLPDICSPLVTDQYILMIASYGDLVCYEREKGSEEPLWEQTTEEIMMTSPSLVGDLVYLVGESGKGWVVRTNEKGFEQVAANELGEPCSASPAFQHGRIYIRGKKHLFCIAGE